MWTLLASFLTEIPGLGAGCLGCFCMASRGSPGTPAPVGTSEKPRVLRWGAFLAQGHMRGRAGPGLLAGVHE